VHIAHVSTPAEIELIQQFKHKGASITSEVAPHHLLLCEDDYEQLGPFLKVNPPVRSRQEVEQLKRHLANGEIDAIATDHAPHTIAEKRASLKSAPSGLPSIEFYVPLLFKIGRMLGIPVPRLVDLGSRTPARLLGLDHIGRIAPGYDASFVLLGEGAWIAEESRVKSKCGWSPYAGFEFPVWVEGTWHRGVRKFARNQSIIPAC
jgi:dihydroorotase